MAEFNSREFERNLKKGLEKIANEGVQQLAAKFQHALDVVHRSHSGRPVEEVKPVLRSALRRADLTPNDAQVRSWSQAISDGTRIVVKPESVRL